MSKAPVQQKPLPVTTNDFLNYEEEQRLEVLGARATRQRLILSDTLQERRKILMRGIRRRRRAEGKSKVCNVCGVV